MSKWGTDQYSAGVADGKKGAAKRIAQLEKQLADLRRQLAEEQKMSKNKSKHNYKCAKCGCEFDEFGEDNYAGSDIIKCPHCPSREIIDQRTGKLVTNKLDLPGTWR